MKNINKTEKHLLDEIGQLKVRIAELEKYKTERKRIEKKLH